MNLLNPVSSRRYRNSSILLGPLVVILSAIAVAALVGGGTAAAEPPRLVEADLKAVSNVGSGPIAVTTADTAALVRFATSGRALADGSLLASRGERKYYRIANTAGPDCYAVGPAQASRYLLGQVMCAAEFPSAGFPVLDFTVIRQPSSDPASARVVRSEGVAADGVADIGFETSEGRLVSVTPVVKNIYRVSVPPTERVTKLVARDAGGATIWTVPFDPISPPK